MHILIGFVNTSKDLLMLGIFVFGGEFSLSTMRKLLFFWTLNLFYCTKYIRLFQIAF